MTQVVFADSNVFIEALFIPSSAAFLVAELVAGEAFDMVTCDLVIQDVERAILKKLKNHPDQLRTILGAWETMRAKIRLSVLPDPSPSTVKAAFNRYIGVMKHKADIPVLAAAISMNPRPYAILSGNREHFNDEIAQRCGIYIGSCREFIELIANSS